LVLGCGATGNRFTDRCRRLRQNHGCLPGSATH
jgi:hypothetical protein